MRSLLPVPLVVLAAVVAGAADPPRKVAGDPVRLDRIRAAKMPAVTRPVRFDMPEADAICSALEVFPPDNPWNLLVENWPLHPNSARIVASVGADKPFRYNSDMGFVLVPPDQPRIDVKLVSYPAELDRGPYKDFDVSKFSPEVRAILTGLKRYGMLVADNGIDWAISVAPDPRIPARTSRW